MSKFSFVAHPSTVSDDIGTDFFCTLFRTEHSDGHDYLFPTLSFAIQIKSSAKGIKLDKKLGYLDELQIPFFIGVVDRERLSLGIYCGEYLPEFLSLKGPPNIRSLRAKLCPALSTENYFTDDGEAAFTLSFPKVLEVAADAGPEKTQDASAKLSHICFRIQQNIASRTSDEQLYVYEDRVKILAGSGSVQVYRDNLAKRLAEAFYNLHWLLKNCPEGFSIEEFEMYESTLLEWKRLYPLPPYLDKTYADLKRDLTSRAP